MNYANEWTARANYSELINDPSDYLRFTLVPR